MQLGCFSALDDFCSTPLAKGQNLKLQEKKLKLLYWKVGLKPRLKTKKDWNSLSTKRDNQKSCNLKQSHPLWFMRWYQEQCFCVWKLPWLLTPAGLDCHKVVIPICNLMAIKPLCSTIVQLNCAMYRNPFPFKISSYIRLYFPPLPFIQFDERVTFSILFLKEVIGGDRCICMYLQRRSAGEGFSFYNHFSSSL